MCMQVLYRISRYCIVRRYTQGRCRANSAHVRRSRLESGPSFEVKQVKPFMLFPFRCCRANLARIRQSGLEPGPGFQATHHNLHPFSYSGVKVSPFCCCWVHLALTRQSGPDPGPDVQVKQLKIFQLFPLICYQAN